MVLSVSCLAQDARWTNRTDEGWCYHPKLDHEAEIVRVPLKQYCLSDSFELRGVDTNFLYFVIEGENLPTIHLEFEGGPTAARRSVATRVSGLVFEREYWEGDLRILRFTPDKTKERSENLHLAYIEFPTGSVVTIRGDDLDWVEKALSDLLD